MKKSALLALILIAFNGHAQFKNFTLRVAATFPVLNSVEENEPVTLAPLLPSSGYTTLWVRTGSIKQSFEGKIGYDLSGRVDYQISERFFLCSGISATYTRFHRNIRVESINEISQPTFPIPFNIPGSAVGNAYGNIILRDVNGDPINQVALVTQPPDVGNSTNWNLQLPLLAGTTFFKKRIYVKAGPAFSYLVYASEIKQHYEYDPQALTLSSYKDTSKDGFNDFLVSGILETTFRVTKRFGFDLTAQHFFTSMYSASGEHDSNVRCKNFTAGVSYMF